MSDITIGSGPPPAKRQWSSRYVDLVDAADANPGIWVSKQYPDVDPQRLRGASNNMRQGSSPRYSPQGTYEATSRGNTLYVKRVPE